MRDWAAVTDSYTAGRQTGWERRRAIVRALAAGATCVDVARRTGKSLREVEKLAAGGAVRGEAPIERDWNNRRDVERLGKVNAKQPTYFGRAILRMQAPQPPESVS